MSYTTAQCKDFLNENLNLTKSNWKRVSKKKNEDGVIIRLFECSINSLSVEVLEMETGLVLGREISTQSAPNTVAPPSLPISPSSASPTPSATTTPPAPALSIDEEKVKASYTLMKAIFLDCDWSDFTLGGIDYTSPEGKQKHYDPYEDGSFWQLLINTLSTYKNLNKKEKLRFVQLAHSDNADFVTSFANKVELFVEHLWDLDETYAPYHMCQHFNASNSMDLGFIDLLNLIKAVSTSILDANLGVSAAQKSAVATAQKALMEKHADALQYLDENEDYHQINSDAIAKAWKSFSLEAFLIDYEKNKLNKSTPVSNNASGSSSSNSYKL